LVRAHGSRVAQGEDHKGKHLPSSQLNVHFNQSNMVVTIETDQAGLMRAKAARATRLSNAHNG
jgi:hypothetical protein